MYRVRLRTTGRGVCNEGLRVWGSRGCAALRQWAWRDFWNWLATAAITSTVPTETGW